METLIVNGTKTSHDFHSGDIIIKPESVLNLHGMCEGSITIEAKGRLYLHGMFSGTITILKGARLLLHGTFNGEIINKGYCKVWGIVTGSITTDGGETLLDKNATIKS